MACTNTAKIKIGGKLRLGRLREGRKLIHESDESKNIDSALVKARLAIEPIRKKLRTIAVARNASADPKQRSQAAREAVVIEAIHSYISGASHDDEITKTFEYTRTDATTMLAAVAGLRAERQRVGVTAALVRRHGLRAGRGLLTRTCQASHTTNSEPSR